MVKIVTFQKMTQNSIINKRNSFLTNFNEILIQIFIKPHTHYKVKFHTIWLTGC